MRAVQVFDVLGNNLRSFNPCLKTLYETLYEFMVATDKLPTWTKKLCHNKLEGTHGVQTHTGS